MEAEFVVSRPVAGVRCFLRYEHHRDYKYCKKYRFDDGRYALRVRSASRAIIKPIWYMSTPVRTERPY